MRKIKQAVIFAGGLGERLKPFTEMNPKSMYPIHGKPFLQYLIEQIKGWGVQDIILLLGYLPEKIMDYFGDGSQFGVMIRYVITPVEYDTQFRLKAAEVILDDDFLMMYCDNLCPVQFDKLVSDYENNHALIQITAYSNEDGYTKNNLRISDDGKVMLYDKKRTISDLRGVDIGYAIVSKSVIGLMSEKNENFETTIYPQLVQHEKLFATITRHRYYSIGSFERISLTEDYLSGQKYIFLDRDGTTNRRPPKAEYICNPDDFIWLDGAREAIKKLNDARYKVIIISNQAGIARGVMTESDFEQVMQKMKNDLSAIGAHIEGVYYCPHGWNDGCTCRKPKSGMLYRAQKDFSLNLTECLMIGDDERDIITAKNAYMRGILVNEHYMLKDAVDDLLNGIVKEYEIRK